MEPTLLRDFCGTADRYQRLQWLDSGAFGDVWKVRDKQSGHIYAAKEIPFRRNYNDEECIVREKSALICLQKNVGIIELMDMVVFPSRVWLVEEFADLGSLQDAGGLHRKLGDNDKVSLVRQLIEAVLWCHRHNLAHMDINPRNILLVTPLTLKLADFGQAAFDVDAVADGDEYLGDSKYLPPEVLCREVYFPKAVDIWSVGCVLYYIFTMNHMFPGSTNVIVKEQSDYCQSNDIVHTLSPPAGELTKAVQTMLCRVLVYKPQHRPPAEKLEKIANRVGLYCS